MREAAAVADPWGTFGFESRLRAATRKLQKHTALLRSWRKSGGRLAYDVTIALSAARPLRS